MLFQLTRKLLQSYFVIIEIKYVLIKLTCPSVRAYLVRFITSNPLVQFLDNVIHDLSVWHDFNPI